jgi:paraquat-inducible protein B
MEAANNAEPKTVLGGKVVSLKAAQAAEAAFDESNRQTGIQQHHDNTTESVPAGQVAGDTSQQERAYYEQQKQAAQMATINATNLQSGQSGVQEHLQQAEQNLQQAQQQLQNQMQQAQGQQQSSQQQQQAERQALAAAAEKTNPMAAEHETAAEMQAEAAQATAKARARAKKE